MKVARLFPTPVGIFEFGRELTNKELSFIESQATRKNIGNTTSINSSILESKQLKKLNEFVKINLTTFFRDICDPATTVDIRVTQSWANYTKPGEYHHKHAHPNSYISGVFYVKADKESDKILFFKDGYNQLEFKSKKYNEFNSSNWWFPVYTGLLLLFPSHLSHMVETVNNEETRISISFNTFLVGNLGDDNSMTGLRL